MDINQFLSIGDVIDTSSLHKMGEQSKNMRYKKCYNCSHSERYYVVDGMWDDNTLRQHAAGMVIFCRVTGEYIYTTNCIAEADKNG